MTQPDAPLCMPAEWEPHAATWLAFPHHRTDWPGKLATMPWVFAEIARVLAKAERVRMLCRDRAERDRARKSFDRAGVDLSQVDFYLKDTNRSWMRDTMPLWSRRDDGRLVAVKFRFDGWSRYRDFPLDEAAGQWVAKTKADMRAVPRFDDGSPIVLEGGSIDVDGLGNLLTTEQCLLTSKRARFRSVGEGVEERRERAEATLHKWLGAENVIWLPDGIVGDDTSGHVDDFARFAPGGRILVCHETRRSDENYTTLNAARRALRQARGVCGKGFEIVELPMPAPVYYDGLRLPASYANFYVGNAAVLVPVFNDPEDRVALDLVAECFPDRPTVGIYARDLVLGLGTLHCSTMQEPLSKEST